MALSPAVDKAVASMALVNADDEKMNYVSHRPLEPERLAIIASAFPECGKVGEVVAIVAASEDGATSMEFVAVIKQDGDQITPELVTGSCQITYEDLTPSECIEYCFPEEPNQWAMAQLSLGALETYRSSKFEAWKAMLEKPTCEAQFRRMLQIGMVSQLYDPHVFPTPDSMKASYQVTDERTGKLIELPHPIKECRVWDAAAQAYKTIDAHLDGAPEQAEAEAWWAEFMKKLNDTHGEEYIAGLKCGR